ncbi:hypothetical protein BCR42DRAFT_417475 [Absidia repens]|uniref:RRM domain-containing protein n=1 Tax=Absidia repens TaxID=90262 RepID=A0A1X2IDZ6_9FUNG|nr:hypothetical protein BCR42DRAFT_417475 [Absidia repens]
MDGRSIFGKKIHIHWSNQVKKQQHYYTILVNDLAREMTSSKLKTAFEAYSPRHVEVIVDTTTTDTGDFKNKSYGLIDFDHKEEAEKAMLEMDGHGLPSPIRCSWANHHVLDTIATTGTFITAPSTPTTPSAPPTPSFSTAPTHPSTACRVTSNNMSYEQIFAQTLPYNTTICVENLPDGVSEQDLIPHFQQYGYVSHIEMNDHGAIIKLDTHANASTAIFALQGFKIEGQAIELSWGTHVTTNDHPAMNYATISTTVPAAALTNTTATMNSNNNSGSNNNISSSIGSGAISIGSNNATTSQESWRFQPNLNGSGYYDLLTMRPPAPVAGSPHSAGGKAGQAIHGWNQYYQNYYSAGHQNI